MLSAPAGAPVEPRPSCMEAPRLMYPNPPSLHARALERHARSETGGGASRGHRTAEAPLRPAPGGPSLHELNAVRFDLHLVPLLVDFAAQLDFRLRCDFQATPDLVVDLHDDRAGFVPELVALAAEGLDDMALQLHRRVVGQPCGGSGGRDLQVVGALEAAGG